MGFVICTVPESARQHVLELVKERREKDEAAFKREENAIVREIKVCCELPRDTRVRYLLFIAPCSSTLSSMPRD
jgi:hypothetical protein